jgi:N-acetylglucosamine malate deacetylase 1
MKFHDLENILFLFAHPDDEAFICGAMRMALDAGAQVHGAWVTSGDFFGGGKRREAALWEGMDILELDESRVHLLRIPDLGIVAEMPRAAEIVAKLVGELKPAKIFVDAFEGGHPDHDAVNFLAYEGSARAGISPEIYEFPLYNGSGSVLHWRWRINSFPPGNNPTLYIPLTEDAIRRKHRLMLHAYLSQWMYMVPARLASPRSLMLSRGESYRFCPPDRDHAAPPHPGTLNYERWFNFFMRIQFRDFRAAVERTRCR